jgi:hypothetical protein
MKPQAFLITWMLAILPLAAASTLLIA